MSKDGLPSVPPARRKRRRTSQPSRLTKTAAGLVLVIGTGGTVPLAAAGSASASGTSAERPAPVARVVDMAAFAAQRRANPKPSGDDSTPTPAA